MKNSITPIILIENSVQKGMSLDAICIRILLETSYIIFENVNFLSILDPHLINSNLD